MFVVKIITDFAAAHALRNYPGDCARIHGHNWKIEVLVAAKRLNGDGMAVDFRDLKTRTKSVIQNLDHQFLNDIAPFDKLNPTAENLAKYFFDEVGKTIDEAEFFVKEIIIWETPRAAVHYSEDDYGRSQPA